MSSVLRQSQRSVSSRENREIEAEIEVDIDATFGNPIRIIVTFLALD